MRDWIVQHQGKTWASNWLRPKQYWYLWAGVLVIGLAAFAVLQFLPSAGGVVWPIASIAFLVLFIGSLKKWNKWK